MKRTLTLILTFLMILSLCSCFKINKCLKLSFPTEEITSICIYYLEEETALDTLWEMVPVYNVPRDNIPAFAQNLETVRYRKTVIIAPVDYAKIFAPGYAVCIEYTNGEYDVFASRGEKTKNGFYPDEYIGDSSWNEIIESFMK